MDELREVEFQFFPQCKGRVCGILVAEVRDQVGYAHAVLEPETPARVFQRVRMALEFRYARFRATGPDHTPRVHVWSGNRCVRQGFFEGSHLLELLRARRATAEELSAAGVCDKDAT
jgi:hypothetical protein